MEVYERIIILLDKIKEGSTIEEIKNYELKAIENICEQYTTKSSFEIKNNFYNSYIYKLLRKIEENCFSFNWCINDNTTWRRNVESLRKNRKQYEDTYYNINSNKKHFAGIVEYKEENGNCKNGFKLKDKKV